MIKKYDPRLKNRPEQRENYFVHDNDEIQEKVLEWGAVVLTSLEKVSKMSLSPISYRIFLFFCANVDPISNSITIKQTELASTNTLSTHKTNISKGIKELENADIICRENKTYYINPDIFYQGKRDRRDITKSVFYNKKVIYKQIIHE